MIPLGSVEAQPVELHDASDRKFKPGLFSQCKAFLSGYSDEMGQLCSLEEQLKAFPIYYQIAGYTL